MQPAFSLKRGLKQNHSAACLKLATSESMTMTPNLMGTTHKKPCTRITSQADTIIGLRSELASFGGTFLEGTSSLAPLPSVIALLPCRKTKAIIQAQELEVDLEDEKLVSLIHIFQTDVNAVDAYMMLKCDGVQKIWVKSTLDTSNVVL